MCLLSTYFVLGILHSLSLTLLMTVPGGISKYSYLQFTDEKTETQAMNLRSKPRSGWLQCLSSFHKADLDVFIYDYHSVSGIP